MCIRINDQVSNFKNPAFTSISPARVYIDGILKDDPEIIKTFMRRLQRILTTKNDVFSELQESFHSCVSDYSNTNLGTQIKDSPYIHTHFDMKRKLGYFFSGMQASILNNINNGIRFNGDPIAKYSNQVQNFVNYSAKLKNNDGDEVIINIMVETKLAKNGKPTKKFEIKKITPDIISKRIEPPIFSPAGSGTAKSALETTTRTKNPPHKYQEDPKPQSVHKKKKPPKLLNTSFSLFPGSEEGWV